MTRRPAVLLLLLLMSASTVLTVVEPAQGARPGTLTPLGCIGDSLPDGTPSDSHHCEQSYGFLDGAGVPVVSRDNGVIYLTSFRDNAVVWFTRDYVSGPTPAGCVADPPAPDGCVEAEGLKNPWGLSLSPNGKQLYVAGGGDDAVVRLDIAPDGSLSDGGCVSAPTGPCATTSPGLGGAGGVAVTPDGRDLYVTGNDDDTVVQLHRSGSGELTAGSCVQSPPVGPGCTAAPGLATPWPPVVSPDGRSVYVPSSGGAVVIFDRTLANGALGNGRCIRDDEMFVEGCSATAPAIAGAVGLDVSPDGKTVYVASNSDHAVSLMRRSADGDLTPAGCVEDVGASSGCSREAEGLNEVSFVAVAPDGDQVLTTSTGDDALTTLDRNADDTLTGRFCVADVDESEASCATVTEGLTDAFGLAMSTTGRDVYAAGLNDNTLVVLKRELRRPELSAAIAKHQRLATLKVRVACDSRCGVTVSGEAKIRVTEVVDGEQTTSTRQFGIVPRRTSLLPGRAVTLRLDVRRSFQLARRLNSGGTAWVRVSLVAFNGFGRDVMRHPIVLRR